MHHVHSLLSFMPHKAWLYVDDILAALWRAQAREGLTIMVIFMQVINAPISWKKAQWEACIQWCGWEINFDYDTIKLSQTKILKLLQLITELLQTPKVCRKLLERTIGLMVWASSISLHLRPHLAPLYADREANVPCRHPSRRPPLRPEQRPTAASMPKWALHPAGGSHLRV